MDYNNIDELYPDIRLNVNDIIYKANKNILMMKSNYFATLFSKKFSDHKKDIIFFDDTNQKMFKYILINIYKMDRINKIDQNINIDDLFDLYIMIDKYDLRLLFSYVNFEDEIIKRLKDDNLQIIINYINRVYEINILNEMNWQKIIIQILETNKYKKLKLDFGNLYGLTYNYQNLTTLHDFEILLYHCINTEYYLIYNIPFLQIYENIFFDINSKEIPDIIISILKLKHIIKNNLYTIIVNLIDKISSDYFYLTCVIILKEYSLLNIDEFIILFDNLNININFKLFFIINYFINIKISKEIGYNILEKLIDINNININELNTIVKRLRFAKLYKILNIIDKILNDKTKSIEFKSYNND